MFENNYKETDIADRRWQTALIFMLLCAVGYCGTVYILGQKYGVDEQEQNAEIEALREMRFNSVKNLCQNISKPEQFNWIDESLIEHSDQRTIFLEGYNSKRTSDEVMPFFQIWLDSNGWTKRERAGYGRWGTTSATVTTFYKINQEISIITNDWTGFYGIECSETDVKKL